MPHEKQNQMIKEVFFPFFGISNQQNIDMFLMQLLLPLKEVLKKKIFQDDLIEIENRFGDSNGLISSFFIAGACVSICK